MLFRDQLLELLHSIWENSLRPEYEEGHFPKSQEKRELQLPLAPKPPPRVLGDLKGAALNSPL